MSDRFALRSRRTLVDGALRDAAVIIDGERIEAVGAPHETDALPCFDLGDDVLMAGLVDCHVHVNEPGRTEWEGFDTATHAAAAGGVTTLVDMPLNCIPVTTSAAAFAEKLAALDGKLQVDVGFWGGVVPGNAAELPRMAAAGVLGCKAFLCHSGIDDFPGSDEAVLREAMPRLRDAGIPLLAHAEIELPGHGHDHPPQHYAAWLLARPPAFEDEAIALLIRLCRETGCPVHVVHLSAATSLPQIRAAKAEGLPFTVETCPHYLCLTAEDVAEGATQYKCAPPIRESRNRDALWEGLRDGTIDFVVTDHSPCTPNLKHFDDGDFTAAWGGISSLQLGLPNVWTEARARGFDLPTVARWLSERPAAFAGLPEKGRLAPGADADLVVWSPEAAWTVTPESLHFRHKVSPYVGKTLYGAVRKTYLRGRPVFLAGSEAGDFPGAARGRPRLHRGART